jgi:antitoxin ChpS
MPKVRVQDVGGTIMLEVPPAVVEQLQLSVGSEIEVETQNGGIVLRHWDRPRYRLEDLIVGSDPRAFEQTEEDREWHLSGPVGRELL